MFAKLLKVKCKKVETTKDRAKQQLMQEFEISKQRQAEEQQRRAEEERENREKEVMGHEDHDIGDMESISE
jgi:hypothetical protein